jgi:hypothetical protein
MTTRLNGRRARVRLRVVRLIISEPGKRSREDAFVQRDDESLTEFAEGVEAVLRLRLGLLDPSSGKESGA